MPELIIRNMITLFLFPDSQAGSYNHHMFGDIKAWFISYVAGINVNPERNDPNRILVKPHFIASLDYAKASYRAPAGKIFVSWKRNGKTVELRLCRSPGIRADVVLPADGFLTHREIRVLSDIIEW